MQDYKLLKLSWIILAVGTVVGMAISVVNIIKPLPFFLQDAFEAYIGQSWSTLVEQQPKYAAMYEHLARECSCYWFVGSLYALFIIFAGYRQGQKWAWIALLLACILGYGSLTVFAAVYFGLAGTWLGIISLCVGLVALLLPVKEIWGAKAGQTE